MLQSKYKIYNTKHTLISVYFVSYYVENQHPTLHN